MIKLRHRFEELALNPNSDVQVMYTLEGTESYSSSTKLQSPVVFSADTRIAIHKTKAISSEELNEILVELEKIAHENEYNGVGA